MSYHLLNLRRASTVGIIATLAGGISTFVVFRLSIELTSLAAVGAWALIQGMFLIARISDIGTGTNITRAVAHPIKQREWPQIGRVVAAGTILSAIPVALIGAALTPVITWYVSRQYGSLLGNESIAALSLLAFVGGLVSSIAAVVMSALEGTFRIVYKSWATVIANLAGLAAAIPLLKVVGIPALGVQGVVVPLIQLILCGVYLARVSLGRRPTGHTPLAAMIRSLWKENLSLSAIGLCRLSFEPATKFLLSLIAPLPFIAVFELALRVSTQMRVTVQAAAQPLLAVGARSNGQLNSDAGSIFGDAQVRLSLVAVISGAVALISSPVISWFGLGSFEPIFLAIFAILVVSNTVNTAGLVGYYYLVSGARLGYLLVVHLLMALLNVLGGAVAVTLHSPITVVLSYGAAFCLGGIMSFTPLRSAIPSGMWSRQSTGIGTPASIMAIIWLAIAMASEVVLFPKVGTGLQIAAAGGSSLLMLALSTKPLKRALGRTKEA